MIYSRDDSDAVVVLAEALNVPVIKALYCSDHTKDKSTFNMYMRYIYFVYRSGGLYENQFVGVRKRSACVHQLGKKDDFWVTIENNRFVKAVIEWYVDNSKSKEEQLLEALDADIEHYLEFLKKIPYTRQVKVETVKGGDDDVVISYKSEDNSDEKMRAIRNSKDLILYRKELKKLVRETSMKKKTGKQFRTRQYET